MSAQHKRPGRTARRRRQERALDYLRWREAEAAAHVAGDCMYCCRFCFGKRRYGLGEAGTKTAQTQIDTLEDRTSQPLLPVPAKQARRLTR